MARDLLESILYYEMDQATASNGPNSSNHGYQDDGAQDMFGFFKQRFSLGGMLSTFAGLAMPFTKRKGSKSSESTPEGIEMGSENYDFCDNIEMAHFGHVESIVKGHDFILQQLTNPTWCDECGDFIWGLYKQCLRCKYCNFTCHQNCVPLVRLPCKSSPNSDVPEDEAVSLETSLSEASDSSQNTPTDGSTDAANEKDETDSGYRSGTIPDEKLPRKPSQATLNREELRKKLDEYNTLVPDAKMQLQSEKTETFQGFVRVVLNLVRPICMSLGSRPPSFYEVLTQEHIVEQNTQTISFYMPRDTVKSIHISSDVTTKDVVSMLLKKFHILDNPRKFALYEQELNPRGKIVKLRRIPEQDLPLHVTLEWDSEKIGSTRFVLQENENGEIDWGAFSQPELQNFLRVLDREESEYTTQLEYKYKVMQRIIRERMKEIRKEKNKDTIAKRDSLYGKPPNQRQSLAES